MNLPLRNMFCQTITLSLSLSNEKSILQEGLL
jgi:hypothetical protein